MNNKLNNRLNNGLNTDNNINKENNIYLEEQDKLFLELMNYKGE